MVQDQLVDYVSSQIKLGVSRDAIKSALVSAGWVPGDVEDTLKKVEGGAGSGMAVAAQPSTMAAKPSDQAMASSTTASKPIVMGGSPNVAKSSDPQMIRVSDLVSASPAVGSGASTTAASVSLGAKINKDPLFGGKISGNTFQATSMSGASGGSNKKGLIGGIVAAILILAFAGLAWYFYSANAGLAAQVTSITSQSASVNAQLSSLQSQLNASSTGDATEIASLTAANTDLALNLSFYAAPVGVSSTPGAMLPVTISGWLSLGGKAIYAVTTPRGAKIFIANSTDAKIAPQLKPLVGQTVQLNGTYIPGSDEMTVSAVTDLSPSAPTMATSTATSSMPMMQATSTASTTP